jgi:hypothetical protein
MSGGRSTARRVTVTVLVVGLVAALLVAAAVWSRRGVDAPQATPAPRAEPASQRLAAGTTLVGRPSCDSVTHGIAPSSVTIPGVTRRAGVVTPPRDANDVPGVPPLTSAGKELFAWDLAQGTRPGGAHGNVLLAAHTWPDGSALGNRMLAHLHEHGRVVVTGGGHRLCYRVTERVEVLAADGLPRYYARHGPPRLAILACSGTRLGPGVWTKRTVWFASPSV